MEINISNLTYASNAIKHQLEKNLLYNRGVIPHNETLILRHIKNITSVNDNLTFSDVSTTELRDEVKQCIRKSIVSILLKQLTFATVGKRPRPVRELVYLDKINETYTTEFKFKQLINHLDNYLGERITLEYDGTTIRLTVKDNDPLIIDFSKPLSQTVLDSLYQYMRDVCIVPTQKLMNYDTYKGNMTTLYGGKGILEAAAAGGGGSAMDNNDS